jgi:signal transduction histidine kinase
MSSPDKPTAQSTTAIEQKDMLLGITYASRAVTHEALTPLNIATGYLELMVEDATLSPHHRQNIQEAISQIMRAADSLNSLPRIRQIITTESPVGPMLDIKASIKPAETKPDTTA